MPSTAVAERTVRVHSIREDMRLPDDYLYQQVKFDLGIDPEKVSESAKRITNSRWDEILDTGEHKVIAVPKKGKHK